MKDYIMEQLIFGTIFCCALAFLLLIGAVCCQTVVGDDPQTGKHMRVLEQRCDSLQREIDSIAE